MTTWLDVRAFVERAFRSERLSDEMVVVQVPLPHGDSAHGDSRSVYVHREVIPPDLEIVAIDSSFGRLGAVDLARAVTEGGQLLAGLVGYIPVDGGGLLALGSRLPAALMDESQLVTLLLTITLIGKAAHTLEMRLTEHDLTAVWGRLREYLSQVNDVAIEREWDDGLIVAVDGDHQRYALLVAQNGPHHITFESALGPEDQVDFVRASACAATTTGGLVFREGLVSIRISEPGAVMDGPLFVRTVGELVRVTEDYLAAVRT